MAYPFFNPAWDTLVDALDRRGITVKVLWSVNRRLGKARDDLACVAFVGRDGVQPSIAEAIVVDHGLKDGFGFYPLEHDYEVERFIEQKGQTA